MFVLVLLSLLLWGAPEPASAQSIRVVPATTVIVDMVRTFIGFPYRLGGNSPKGLDCSALVQRTFRAVGIELPRTASRQFQQGCAVAREELTAGDLVFFHGGKLRAISHVGIYIGGGYFIHAARHGVVIASLHAEHWTRRFAGARRLLEEAPATAIDTNLCTEDQ
jgi:cell wall-associated NlpC family hydrolase